MSQFQLLNSNSEAYPENRSFLAEIPLTCSNGNAQQPAKLEWSPVVGAKYYVLEIAGDDVRDDRNLAIGAKTSLEIHYNALVMKKADEKPEEMELRVYLSAMGGENALAKAACEKLSKCKTFKHHRCH